MKDVRRYPFKDENEFFNMDNLIFDDYEKSFQ